MANFKVKNGLQAGRYLLNSTTLSGSTIDLSLASMFSTTLSSDPAYAFTNPPASGNAQAFSVEVTGGTTTFTQDSFATTLYTGNSSTQTITNGLDLAGDGGLIWTKVRDQNGGDHSLIDSASSWADDLVSNKTDAAAITSYLNFSASSTGYSINTAAFRYNENNANYVSWTFKKQAKFFDVVTFTGTGSDVDISHNLGAVPAMIIGKRTDASGNWMVWHIGTGMSNGGFTGLSLNTTASAAFTGVQSDQGINSSTFNTGYVLSSDSIKAVVDGASYVFYLFAHDTASDSRIKCGSYTGTGAIGNTITLGWEPQWIMVKNTDTTTPWVMVDVPRGMPEDGSGPRLLANASDAEVTNASFFAPRATGFEVTKQNTYVNTSGQNYIYMAIRASAATDSAITWPSSVKWPSGLAPTTPAPGKKDLFTFLTTDGGTTYYGKKAAEGIA
ncbi:hypothetical protein N9928_01855 [bacterium]|nr:hypothetical protein [bacterium]